MYHDVQILHSEDDRSTKRVSVTVSELPEPKSDNGHQRQTAAITEFVLLEGRASEEIMIRLRDIYGLAAYPHASVFRWISDVHRGNEELETKDTPEDPVNTKLMR
jgi:hypothetical protein